MNKQRVIIMEGPDMCGKTQIAMRLSEVTGIPYFKASSEHKTYLKSKNTFVEQLRIADPRVADLLGQTGHSVIFDRAYPSEWVYSSVFGRETDMRALEEVDAAYAAMGANIVITYRKSYKGIVDDIDPSIDAMFLERIDAKYQEFTKWTKCSTFRMHVDDEDLDREIKDLSLALGV